MKHSLIALSLLFSVSSFANSVSCYVDKESRYANGRPSNDVIVILDIREASSSLKYLERGSTLIPGFSRGESTLLVTVGEALNWPDENHEFPSNVRELISLDVQELMKSGKGNLTSESVTTSDGTRIHLRCDGKN